MQDRGAGMGQILAPAPRRPGRDTPVHLGFRQERSPEHVAAEVADYFADPVWKFGYIRRLTPAMALSGPAATGSATWWTGCSRTAAPRANQRCRVWPASPAAKASVRSAPPHHRHPPRPVLRMPHPGTLCRRPRRLGHRELPALAARQDVRQRPRPQPWGQRSGKPRKKAYPVDPGLTTSCAVLRTGSRGFSLRDR